MKELFEHVVIIGVDGMGNFNKMTAMPETEKLFGNGAQSFDAISLYPTISAQNWGAMLLGTLPEVHGLTNSIVSTTEYTNKEFPSIFTTVRQKYPDAFLCSCSNWNPINHGIIEHDIDVEMHTADNDDILIDTIEECISRKPKLLFIQFDDVDGAGHSYVYGTEKHLEQIRKTDTFTGRIYNAYKNAGIADNTLFIELADHGGNNKGHGGYSDGEKYIYFALSGKGVKQGTIPYAETRDINAIVRYAFGIEIPEFNEQGYSSQVPLNAFVNFSGDYKKSEPKELVFTTELTPDLNAENGLFTQFDKKEIELALFFDSSISDATGKHTLNEVNRVKYYSGGRYGAYGEMGATGYLKADDIHFGTDSFAVSCWIKLDKAITENCIICGTKASRTGAGFLIGFTCAGTMLGIETDERDTYSEFITTSVNEVSGGWLHVIYSFDRENNTVDVYHNFNLKKHIQLKDFYRDYNLDAHPFIIGNDAACERNDKDKNYIFNCDDFILFNTPLSEKDVDTLKAYYKI